MGRKPAESGKRSFVSPLVVQSSGRSYLFMLWGYPKTCNLAKVSWYLGPLTRQWLLRAQTMELFSPIAPYCTTQRMPCALSASGNLSSMMLITRPSATSLAHTPSANTRAPTCWLPRTKSWSWPLTFVLKILCSDICNNN